MKMGHAPFSCLQFMVEWKMPNGQNCAWVEYTILYSYLINNVCLLQILLAFEFEILSVKVFINSISFILCVAACWNCNWQTNDENSTSPNR